MESLSFEKAKETFSAKTVELSCRELFKLREEFVSIFSIEKISSMKIEEYVVGLQSRNSFCYWLERTLHSLGNISGQGSFKFGIWYSPSKKAYCFQTKFGNTYEEAYNNVKSAILDLLIDGEKKDYESIAKNPINSAIKGKILATYYPDKYMNIYASKHLDYYMKALGISSKELLKSDVVYKREALVKFKNNDEDMKGWSNYVFSAFLWSHYPKSPRRNGISLRN